MQQYISYLSNPLYFGLAIGLFLAIAYIADSKYNDMPISFGQTFRILLYSTGITAVLMFVLNKGKGSSSLMLPTSIPITEVMEDMKNGLPDF